jgi:hypothetical protein
MDLKRPVAGFERVRFRYRHRVDGIDATWSTFVIGAVTVLAVSLHQLVKYQRRRRAERRRETLHS